MIFYIYIYIFIINPAKIHYYQSSTSVWPLKYSTWRTLSYGPTNLRWKLTKKSCWSFTLGACCSFIQTSHDNIAWGTWYILTFKEVAVVLFLYVFGWIDFSKVIVKLVKCQKMFCNKSCLSEKSKNNGKDGIVYRGTKKLNCGIDHLQLVSFLLSCSFGANLVVSTIWRPLLSSQWLFLCKSFTEDRKLY